MDKHVTTLIGSFKYIFDQSTTSRFTSGQIIIFTNDNEWFAKLVAQSDITECHTETLKLTNNIKSFTLFDFSLNITFSDDSIIKFVSTVRDNNTRAIIQDAGNVLESLKKKEQVLSICYPSEPPRGFVNYGVNCYANAILQLLSKCDDFVHSLDKVVDKCKPKAEITDLLLRVYRERSTVMSLVESIAEKYPVFDTTVENDAGEFLGYLLDAIDEEFEAINDKCGLNNPVKSYFGIYFKKFIKCKKCKNALIAKDYYSISTLYPPAGPYFTLQSLLDESMIEHNVEFTCSNCPNRSGDINMLATKLPKYFVIHVNRISVHSEELFYKSEQSICISREIKINLFPHSETSNGNDGAEQSKNSNVIEYSITAVVNHYGAYNTSGHYTCDVRTDNGQWYSCNDCSVYPESDEISLLKSRENSSLLYLYVANQ